MIDLAKLKARIALLPNATDETPITRRCLEQMVAELTAARSAEQNEGSAFGLRKGVAL